MQIRKTRFLISIISLLLMASCGEVPESKTPEPAFPALATSTEISLIPSATSIRPIETSTPAVTNTSPLPSITPSLTALVTSTNTPSPTVTEVVFEIGQELTIDYLRELEIDGSEITFEQELADRSNYHQHLVSYISEGNKIYGLLTIPFTDPPDSGFKAIVFNHGYIPPTAYRTTERYSAYVDYLARNES